MGDIHVYLENGFDHDRVTVSVGDEEHTESDVSTRYQVGLASVVELQVQDDAEVAVRIAVPERGLAADAQVDPTTPYVRVNITGDGLDVEQQAAPPMLA